ncbi:MAG TPA: isocitrate/isopropylmalate family dehydrogenase [Ktedonobacteraceae bacterium]|jgi:isocitrate dehydrogenase (NAD+)
MQQRQVVLIAGDGVGPEITRAAVSVIESTGVPISWQERPAGIASLETRGKVVPDETLDAIRQCGAALKGPFYTPSGGHQRSANWYIRRELDLYANVRPLWAQDEGIDIVLVRENIEDLYGAVEWMAAPGIAHAVKLATRAGCERIARFAFDLCMREKRRRVSVVHKANNLKLTEGMFLDVARTIAEEYPTITCDDVLADTAAAMLVSHPQSFDVILTSNTFGDLLSSVGAARVGSLGLFASANIGKDTIVAEAVHGSAMELAGSQKANPTAMIMAGAMLLSHIQQPQEASAIQRAVWSVLRRGIKTPDLGGTATTNEVAEEVVKEVIRQSVVERQPLP